MITFDVSIQQLDESIRRLSAADALIEREFGTAARNVVGKVVPEMRQTPARVSGATVASITGEVQSVTGSEITARFTAGARRGGVDYPALLDQKGGRRTWRSGRFAGRRTFGWWTNYIPKVALAAARDEMVDALTRVAEGLTTDGA